MRLLRRIQAVAGTRVPGSDPYDPRNNPYDDGYPGERAPPPDLTDEAQMLGLGPAAGDTEATHQTLNHPWGKVLQLFGDGKTATLVQTEAFPRPFPWAIQARFSTDGKTFTPTVPAGWGGDVIFKFTKSFDVKTGPAIETFDLIAGDALPICQLIARKLTVQAKIIGEAVLTLWVQFVVCPTTQMDCAELIGPSADGGATIGNIFRIVPEDIPDDGAITAPGIQALLPNPKRAQIIIQNHAETNMYIAFSNSVAGAAPPGSDPPRWSILLPPAVTPGDLGVSNYVSDADVWKGSVYVVWDDADGDPPPGDAMVTELLVP